MKRSLRFLWDRLSLKSISQLQPQQSQGYSADRGLARLAVKHASSGEFRDTTLAHPAALLIACQINHATVSVRATVRIMMPEIATEAATSDAEYRFKATPSVNTPIPHTQSLALIMITCFPPCSQRV